MDRLLACVAVAVMAVAPRPAPAHPACPSGPGTVLVPYHVGAPPGPDGWVGRPTYDVAVIADGSFVQRWGADGGWRAEAGRLLAEADLIYEQIAVDITIVNLHADEIGAGNGAERLEALRTHLLAAHPDLERDAVLLLVHDEIGSYGAASCIGGAGSNLRAMAIVTTDWRPIALDFPAEDVPKVIAHELGHLLGGQHHYGNCVEGDTSVRDAPCTLMTPYLAGRRMGTIEALTMRGWAETHL